MDKLITIFCKMESGELIKIKISRNKTIKDLKEKIKEKTGCQEFDLYFKNKLLHPSKTLFQSGLIDKDTIFSKNENYRIEECYRQKIVDENQTKDQIRYIEEGLEKFVLGTGEGEDIKDNPKEEENEEISIDKKLINIKFLKLPYKNNVPNSNNELSSLLKLCLLKEISAKISPDKLEKLPSIINLILKILKNGYKDQTKNVKEDIKKILEKIEGSNIINFSRFVDKIIDSAQVQYLINLLNIDKKNEIINIKNRLARYEKDIKVFDKQFALAMKDSIIEFSVISLAIIEREDFEKYEKGKKNCPNRVEKLLFHGTGEDPVACILTQQFRKSINRCYQHGKGVYFSDMLDYCWFYGNKSDNRANGNKIPKKDETFTLIACSTYYDNNGWKHVYNEKRTPDTNQINFAYADAEFDTILEEDPDKTKFFGTEYVIWCLDQICPFIGAKLKRVEYCCIWRDNNFSKKILFDPKTTKFFKKYLEDRMRYIEEYAEFNIYPCETSEEALKLIKRKKYNKIILLSNIGTDKGGRDFVNRARKIIGKDVVVLFSAYDEEHLKWVKDYKNALFSNQPYFFEKYLKCFSDNFSEDEIKENIINLKKEVEDHYEVNFNFDDSFLEYPHYKSSGHYSDLSFN